MRILYINYLILFINNNVIIIYTYWNTNNENCGNINKDNIDSIFQTDIYQKWRTNITLNKKKCLKCPAIYICGGGCPKQSEDLFGKQKHIDLPFCIHTRYSLKELLKREYQEKYR